tara:strand:- start:3478 stop:3609 length:132 start_codon:yes stop_codon:yes gene_type:complete
MLASGDAKQVYDLPIIQYSQMHRAAGLFIKYGQKRAHNFQQFL